jgi:hypothetical protein
MMTGAGACEIVQRVGSAVLLQGDQMMDMEATAALPAE